MNMFGPLTRSRLPFFPTRLLCKRFNVKPPPNVSVDPGGAPDAPSGGSGAGGGGGSGSGKSLELVSQTSLNRMMADANWNRGGGTGGGGGGFVAGGTEGGEQEGQSKEVEVEVVNAERNAALEGQKAGEAVFNSIFGNDSEEE